MSKITFPFRVTFLLSLAGAFAVMTSSSAAAQVIDIYEDERLQTANEAYESSRYNETLHLTSEHLSDGESSTIERVQAYRLQGLAFVAQGDEQEAAEAAENLVRLYPGYETINQDPPAFNELIEEAKVRHERGELARSEPAGDPMQIVYTSTAIVMSAVILGYGMWDLFLQ